MLMSKRVCNACHEEMVVGYVIDQGIKYFCSIPCRRTYMTDEEYADQHDAGDGDSYWTVWEDDDVVCDNCEEPLTEDEAHGICNKCDTDLTWEEIVTPIRD